MNLTAAFIKSLLALGLFFSILLLCSCSVLSGGGSATALTPSNKGKLAIVPLRNAERGERLTYNELGFRFIPHESYSPLHLRLEECNAIDTFALRTNVRESQPLMRTHFRGL